MSAEWEKDNNSGVKVNKWEGEDSDDEVKDNWDDEDEKESASQPDVATKAPQIAAKKKKLVQKIAEKERKELEAKVVQKPKTTEELLADKLERQRLEEESDLLLAKEAFGESNSGKTGDSGLDISLNTREDFETFKKSLVDKLLVYDKSVHYVNFLENLFRELCVSIESDDIKRLSGSLTALFNEKVKAQKAGTKGKKKGKGYSVRVERNDLDTGLGNDNFEEFDDFI